MLEPAVVVSLGGLKHEGLDGADQRSPRHLLRAPESAEGARRTRCAGACERKAAAVVAQALPGDQKPSRVEHTSQASSNGVRWHPRARASAFEGKANANNTD